MPDKNWDILAVGAKSILRSFDGKKFEEERPCPECKTRDPYKVGYNERVLAILIDEGSFKKIRVKVKRFRCRECGNHYYASDAPFYPQCDYGRMIIDLCLYLLQKQDPPTVEHTLKNLGIQIDRDTVARYQEIFPEKDGRPFFPKYGMGADILEVLISSTTSEYDYALYKTTKK